ncbi:MAG: Hsp20/alpha crystallin family protein [Lewinellaceae bacterium]|nr:Hsp20/alpha crystallin family protein [Phaeodactylibacter sp.]MCB9348094.1 Hsp20/alpha crystallin family protein [Lewinellaceae bacterium]
MTVVNVKPVVRKRNQFNDFDRIFNEFFHAGLPAANRNGNSLKAKPAVNVIENGGAFRIEVAAPGLEKGDFAVDVDKNVLRIEVNKEFKAKEGETYKRREFGYHAFKRSFQLPDTIDTDGISANYVNGILLVNLPKKEEAKEKPARTIQIG